MTSRREDLIQAVVDVQNMLECPVDILSFCGFPNTTDEQIATHLEHYVVRIQKETDKKIRGLRRAA